MDDNVVSLPGKRRWVWVCSCGCSTYELMAGTGPQCANCSAPLDDGEGWAPLPDRSSTKAPEDCFRVIWGNGDTDFRRLRMAARAREPEVALIVLGFQSGEVSVWSAATCRDHAEWAKSRLALATSMIDATEY